MLLKLSELELKLDNDIDKDSSDNSFIFFSLNFIFFTDPLQKEARYMTIAATLIVGAFLFYFQIGLLL